MNPVPSVKSILFATDFSFYSDKAREYASYLARELGSSVTVLHVIERIFSVERENEQYQIKEWYQNLEEELRGKLDGEISRFREAGVEVRGELVYGHPWETVVDRAEREGMDLIVLGSHGIRTREGRFLLGTTSHKVAMTSRVPVLIIRAESGQSADE